VKIRNRYRFHRLWLALFVLLLGVVVGYFVGRESILHDIGSRLDDYTVRLLQHEEELGDEVARTLAAAIASPHEPCSDQDISLLRRLTFQARFLKDVGRLQGTSFFCSATSPKLVPSIPMQKPDVLLKNGAGIYRSYPLHVPAGDRAEIITFRNADLVLSPDVFSDFPNEPIHYAVGVPDTANVYPPPRDPAKGTVLTGATGSISIPPGVLDAQRTIRIGDTLYRGRCSSRVTLCTVANIRMQEVAQRSRSLMMGYIASGGVAGLCCAAVVLAAGRKRRSHTNQLKRAILMGKLSVVYQPIVELGTHRIVGAEALARWTDEDGESIRPETIVALAEAEGFVSEITRFVLTRSLEEIRPIIEWKPDFILNINLSPADLTDPRLLLLLDESLNGTPIRPSNIAFELPERATSDRDIAIAAIRRLRQRGHATFIDDFGTGYSNLSYLTELNVTGIKISRSFTATIGTDSVTASIVPQIIEVAKALHLEIVIQGIEREEQARYFATNNPAMLSQGWFFGHPVPAKGLMYLCAEKTE
jgi:sensor c-di-GMP phosphodiesterase-like protein